MKMLRSGIPVCLLATLFVFTVTTRAVGQASDPPTVSMEISPTVVLVGQPFDITVTGTDDVGLDMIWWTGVNTGIVDLDKAHIHAGANATYATHTWTISIDQPGVYTFGANSRDIHYWTDLGYPHQASEGDGIDYETVTVIGDPTELVYQINEYIQGLPDDCFKNNADNRKNTFGNKLAAIIQMIDSGDYMGAINKLEHDIKDKVDKWITCSDAQVDLTDMIDTLISYLSALL